MKRTILALMLFIMLLFTGALFSAYVKAAPAQPQERPVLNDALRGPGHEFVMNGAQLVALMNQNPAVAAGYMIGVHDAGAGVTHCAPKGTSKEFFTFIVENLQEVPTEIMNDPQFTADFLIMKILQTKFPCKRA